MYVLLVLKLIPAGMTGIIVAAMFTATMAAISADLNALASVLTRDFYFRVLRPASSERALVRAGRLFTLALGVIVIGRSLWIALSHQESLFHAMVTVFGLFLAPAMLPVLAGLTIRGLTWKGALCGFLAGLAAGVTTLCIKTWYLPHVPGISPEFVNYTFEAISILINIGMTVLGMWLGSVISARDPVEQKRIAMFFDALDTPVTRSEAPGSSGTAARPVLGVSTMAVGALLIAAGLSAGSARARWMDLPFGAALAALGSRLIVAATLLMVFSAAAQESEWLLPNFAQRLSVDVSNPAGREVHALVTVPVAAARAVAPDFPGSLALAVMLDATGAARKGLVIPSQSDDLDGDGVPDEFEFPVTLKAGEKRRVDVYYSTTLRDPVAWPKRVNARHNYGYNREVAAIESEEIGYRTYGGFFLDVIAREAGRPGLYNDAAGYVPVRLDLGTGRDVLHIGDSLGLGGIFLRRAKVHQPPMNVPTYAHQPSPEIVPHYRVIADGPLRAIIEASLSDWNVDGDLITLKARYFMDEGEPFVRCRFEAIPVRMPAGREYEVGIGLRDLPAESRLPGNGLLIVSGKQNERDGMVGLGLYFDPADFPDAAEIRTAECANQAVIYKKRLAPGQTVRGEYALAAAWKGSGIADPTQYLAEMAGTIAVRVKTEGLRFSRTPRPEKVEAEAQ